jgi:LysR family transcriptional regulator, transcriptional activator for dmlA
MGKQVDLNDIPIFVAVARAGTLNAAAKELHVPTSTVSRALTRLEERIGLMLIQRSPKGLLMTDAGRGYLPACKRGLRTLRDGGEALRMQNDDPRGLIRISCPLSLARDVLAPVLLHFIKEHPKLRIEIEPCSSGWDREPREDVDVFFKLRTPKDSSKRVRFYPGTARGIFASPEYLSEFGTPNGPMQLATHRCIGSGLWKLTKGSNTVVPEIEFHVVASDPGIHLTLAMKGAGIAVLPVWMAMRPEVGDQLRSVLPDWKPAPISVCVLSSGPTKLNPKVRFFFAFLDRYFGTEFDPRLGKNRTKDLFTDLHLPVTAGP